MQLDNEASPAFQALLKDKFINYLLAPPGMHRHNAVEQAISTFKDHFIAVLFATYPEFPIQNWDHPIGKAEITPKLLCPSRFNLRLLSYT